MKLARRSLFQGIGAVLLARAALKLPEPVQRSLWVFVNGLPYTSLLNDALLFVGETKP